MPSTLVIVESPTKARTLSRFLGEGFLVDASMGHIRDLPKGRLGVDIQNDFEPEYIIPRDKKKIASYLQQQASTAQEVYLATDPDREGEAIAWHLQYVLSHPQKKPKKKSKDRDSQFGNNTNAEHSNSSELTKYKRVAFHEITEHAIKEAFENPRPIDLQLVDAQQARRILDRLVGYSLSPVLWKKIKSGLSAGRVQSVALRIVVEREKEILAFKPVEYWSIKANLETTDKKSFWAELIEKDSQKLEIGNQKQASEAEDDLKVSNFQVGEVIKKQIRRYPSPPFTTSTLQQTSGNRLGFSAKKTMMLAQNLYEHGLITYMRTDSVNLSTQSLSQIHSYLRDNFPAKYCLPSARVFKSKVKNAQEAHEAIRPTHIAKTADQLEASGLTRDHRRIYDLIWRRTLASQMAEALVNQTTVNILATPKSSNTKYMLRSTGSVVIFDGWLKLYIDKTKKPQKDSDEDTPPEEQILPDLEKDDKLALLELLPEQHFTEPPPRFTESSLVKKLEELGIGRPSTYAPTMSTLQERIYVEKSERKLFPSELGIAVSDFLTKFFPKIVDFDYTAEMEESLDEISRGEKDWRATMAVYYKPIEETVEAAKAKATKVKIAEQVTDKVCPECNKPLVVRFGRFGKFLACSGFPDCKHTEALEQKLEIPCPDCGGDIVVKRTKKGKPFYGCSNYPKCKFATWTKPKTPKAKANEK